MEDLNTSLNQYKDQVNILKKNKNHTLGQSLSTYLCIVFGQSHENFCLQLTLVNQALENVTDETGRESLVTLQSDLEQLIQLTQENLDSIESSSVCTEVPKEATKELDDEYALFMVR